MIGAVLLLWRVLRTLLSAVWGGATLSRWPFLGPQISSVWPFGIHVLDFMVDIGANDFHIFIFFTFIFFNHQLFRIQNWVGFEPGGASHPLYLPCRGPHIQGVRRVKWVWVCVLIIVVGRKQSFANKAPIFYNICNVYVGGTNFVAYDWGCIVVMGGVLRTLLSAARRVPQVMLCDNPSLLIFAHISNDYFDAMRAFLGRTRLFYTFIWSLFVFVSGWLWTRWLLCHFVRTMILVNFSICNFPSMDRFSGPVTSVIAFGIAVHFRIAIGVPNSIIWGFFNFWIFFKLESASCPFLRHAEGAPGCKSRGCLR